MTYEPAMIGAVGAVIISSPRLFAESSVRGALNTFPRDYPPRALLDLSLSVSKIQFRSRA